MHGDSWINESLRNVAVPDSLSARLREIGSMTDGDLDAALQHPVPRGKLRDRLLAIGTRSDADLDDELRSVPVSAELLDRCSLISVGPETEVAGRGVSWRTHPAAQYVMAASLLIMAATIGWRLLRVNQVAAPLPANPVAQQDDARQEDMFLQPSDLESLPTIRPKSPELPTPPHNLVHAPHVSVPAPSPLESFPGGKTNPAVSQNSAPQIAVDPARRPMDAENVFGNSPDGDVLPDLLSVRELEARGIRPPAFREYDLIFQLRHGVHPFVAPGARAELAAVRIPLTTSTTTFDYALDRAASGRSPASSNLRVEDFLAGMDYEFSRPAKPTLGLRTAAGISPWSEQGRGLIQFGVQAGDAPRDPKSAKHVTLIVDMSSAMGRLRRWETVVEGLTTAARQLTPEDRVTLVLAGTTPETVLRDATPERLKNWLPKLAALTPRNGDPLPALATTLDELEASAAQPKFPRRIVLLTAGTNRADAEFDRVAQVAARVLPTRAVLDVFDLRGADVVDPRLATIASWSRGESESGEGRRGTPLPTPNARELAAGFRTVLDDRSPIIAHDVTLRVKFVPESVALYRLLGHEATAVAGLIPLEWRTDLRSGEAATALFEVALRPDGPETVAHATLEWRDSAGKSHVVNQPISRLQFAPSFAEAPWSLQLAALAAETAEVLRGSYFAPVGSHDLAQVSAAAARLPDRRSDKTSLKKLRRFWSSERSAVGL